MLSESLSLDLRYAWRGMRRTPLFSLTVASTIGLGLGILCSAFTIVNAYLLSPIDLPRAHELYAVSWDTETTRRHLFTLADYESLRETTPHFSDVAASRASTLMFNGRLAGVTLVSGNYFPMLGARPMLGRTLTPNDVTTPGSDPVVVLSEPAWRTRFGADPAIVGRRITLGRQSFDVVGVLPPGFGMTGGELVSFWVPLTMARSFTESDPFTNGARVGSLEVVGRLKNGASLAQVRSWIDTFVRQRLPAGSTETPTTISIESRATRIPLTGTTLAMFSVLLAAFGLVLLVACANVTNLFLARTLGRQREVAVRLSLGAGQWRIARQLLIESLVLAVPAAIVGLALTFVTARVFPALITSTFPAGVVSVDVILTSMDPDLRVLAFLAAAAVAASVLVSIAPAIRATRTDLVRASKGEAAMESSRSRLRTGLVAMQIGACVLFLVGASGFIGEAWRMSNPQTGLDYERVLSLHVEPDIRAAVAARLTTAPDIEQVAAAWSQPLTGPLRRMDVITGDAQRQQNVGFTVVSPEYFPTLRIDVVRGRTFTSAEAIESAPLVMVSENTARALWPGLDPVGQTLELVAPVTTRPGDRRPTHTQVRVIGVTKDVVSGIATDDVDPTCVYFVTTAGADGEMNLLIRSRVALTPSRAIVTAAVNDVERDAPFQLFAMTEMLGTIAWVFRAFSAAATLLGLVGLLLAFSGTYAVVAFLVTQRTREFGVRMALGATVRQIISTILADTMRVAAMGVAAGALIAFAFARVVGGANPLVPDFGAFTYLIAIAVVAIATATAALLPSLRTARIDPAKALRVN